MNKTHLYAIALFLFVIFSLSIPSGALAQYSYTPNFYGSIGTCVNLTGNLYKGLSDITTGGQVSALQSFLITQRYLPIIVPSGYFGPLTAQAVARYQLSHELPSDGTVGVLTRASIRAASCGNDYRNYIYNPYFPYSNSPVITSLSANSGYEGRSITIYGSGFDSFNNTVNFNGVRLTGIPSYAGKALAFSVPRVYERYDDRNYSNTSETYSISVTTSRGTSNSMPFRVISDDYCFDYNDCYDDRGELDLSSLSPTSGRVGTRITIRGSGFTRTGNTVHFGIGGKTNVSSSNGTTINFTIPSHVSPCDLTDSSNRICATYLEEVDSGRYPVYVSNRNGSSDRIYFTVR